MEIEDCSLVPHLSALNASKKEAKKATVQTGSRNSLAKVKKERTDDFEHLSPLGTPLETLEDDLRHLGYLHITSMLL